MTLHFSADTFQICLLSRRKSGVLLVPTTSTTLLGRFGKASNTARQSRYLKWQCAESWTPPLQDWPLTIQPFTPYTSSGKRRPIRRIVKVKVLRRLIGVNGTNMAGITLISRELHKRAKGSKGMYRCHGFTEARRVSTFIHQRTKVLLV